MNYTDTHAHYDDAAFDTDREAVLESLKDAGITKVVDCAQDVKTSKNIILLAKKYGFMYSAVGIHPEQALEASNDDYQELLNLTSPSSVHDGKIVAVGETGLDYHYEDAVPRDIQKRNFVNNIEIAIKRGLPIVIHDREAHNDCLEILKECGAFGKIPVVFHCFSGSGEFASVLAKLGTYFSFGGVVTFKNARNSAEAIRRIPEDRLMLETDCPYLSPEPYRGKRNTSRNIPLIAGKIAEILGVSQKKIAEITNANAERFFGFEKFN